MRILFDQGVPRGLAESLLDRHQVTEARQLGWEEVSNGDLITRAEAAGFDLLLATDKNWLYPQNLAGRRISLVVLGQSLWWLVRSCLDAVVTAVDVATPGSFVEIPVPRPPKPPHRFIL